MGELINAENAPVVEGEAAVVETGLPSDAAPEVNLWDAKELLGEDGMVGGKYKSLDALLKAAQEGDKHIADLNAARQRTNDTAANEAAKAEADVARTQTAQELVRTILEGDMAITEDILAAAKEAGISPESLELAAMKGKAHIDKMTAVVGGHEVYNQMMTDMGAGMNDAEKAAFTKDVQSAESEYTVRGIHQAWLEKTGQKAPAQRIQGQQPSTATGVKPYANQAEMQKDLRYLQTRGKNDVAAQKLYSARKSVTSDDVFYGRQ